jgi:ribosome-associated toxin RatA of RatAB toxin-antitoxin module
LNEIRKTALVAYSAERIFDLIEAAEHYPEFLPAPSHERTSRRWEGRK